MESNCSGDVDINMKKLPPEILTHIFSYLRAEDLVVVRDVSRLWNEVSQSSNIWRRTSYDPSREVQYGDVEKFLKRAPKLQSFLPQDGINYRLSKLLIKYCPYLRKLSLNLELLSEGEITELLGHYPCIEELELMHINSPCRRPRVFYSIANCCQSLKSLDLLFLGVVTDLLYDPLRSLGNATHLTDLKLSVSGTNYELIRNIIASNRYLESLTLKFDHEFEVTSLDILEGVPKLKHLSLIHVNPLLLSSLFEQDVSKLQYLLIHGYRSSCHLETIFTKCLSLKTLAFSHCFDLCDDQLKRIKELQHLEYLTMYNCHRVTDGAILYVCECPNLRALELRHCAKLTDRTPAFVMNSKKLSRFTFKESDDWSIGNIVANWRKGIIQYPS